MKSKIVAVLTKEDVAALSKPGCPTCASTGFMTTELGKEPCICLGLLAELHKRHEQRLRDGEAK